MDPAVGWMWLLVRALTERGLQGKWAFTIAAGMVLLGVAVVALLVNWVVKRLVVRSVGRFAERSSTHWDDVLVGRGVFRRLSHLAPAVVIYLLAEPALGGWQSAVHVVRLAAQIYMIGAALFAGDALLNALVDGFQHYEFSRRVPVRGFVQVIKIFLVAYALISVVSLLLGKSPGVLLGGLGALTAVLMLIFKDSILGLVAGVQLSTNQMLHLGDWIEMPKYGADGDVIDISLTTVKVRNWDKTISTIPAYALISDSFKNWRGMQESGGRRIKRSLYIDMTSIRFCDEAMLERLGRIACLRDYLARKRQELAAHNAALGPDHQVPVNGRRLTNIGTFRAYLQCYLRQHPLINQQMTFLVRHLEPTPQGLPIQVYVFSKDKVWANYEALQADIFDHILAVVGEFGLRVFQNPTGADLAGWRMSAPTGAIS